MTRNEQPATRVADRQQHPVRQSVRRAIRWVVTLRGSPEAIGRGIAIGIFVAFTPTIGLQMVIAAVLATLLNANRPAAIAPVWITNPFTLPPLFLLTYWVGTFLWPGPSLQTFGRTLHEALQGAAQHPSWHFAGHLEMLLYLGRDVFLCLLLGGMLVGAVCGVSCYFPTVWLVRRLRAAAPGRRRP